MMKRAVVEERFEHKGFSCVVLFLLNGYRTGYVGLPNDNKYYGKEYDDIPVDCHCGLTYASSNLFGQEDKDIWWIGFDTGHCCDGFDTEALNKYFSDDEMAMKQIECMKGFYEIQKDLPVRTLDYVKQNCKDIVEQILKTEET